MSTFFKSLIVLILGFSLGKIVPNVSFADANKQTNSQFYEDKNFQFWNTIYGLIGNSVTIITGCAFLYGWYLTANKGQVSFWLIKSLLADNNCLLFSDTRTSSCLQQNSQIDLQEMESILYEINGIAKKAGLTTGIFNSVSTHKQFLLEGEFNSYPILPQILSAIRINNNPKIKTNEKNLILEIVQTWDTYVQDNISGGQLFAIQKAITLNLLQGKIGNEDFQKIWSVVH